MRRALMGSVLVGLGVGLAPTVAAQEAEAELDARTVADASGSEDPLDSGSTLLEEETYEQRRVRLTLEERHLGPMSLEEAEGKRIAFVRSVREDVFVEGEGPMSWLQFANAFHVTTREPIVERELLFAEGDTFDLEKVEETMRNLRNLFIFTYVRIVPVRTTDPDEVGVLVYTRDLWSLRLETAYQVTGRQIDELLIQVTERNLLGRRKSASVRFYLEPDVYRLGETYFDRRMPQADLELWQSGDLIFRRNTRELEGGFLQAALRRPFYNLGQRIGFELVGAYQTEIDRNIRNGRVEPYDIPETDEEETIRQVYRDRLLLGRFALFLRKGEGHRRTFGLGFEARDRNYRPIGETMLAPDQRSAFERDVLPRERRELGPFVSYTLFTPTFLTYENLGTFGQSENLRSGPFVELRARFPLRALGSSSDSAVFVGNWGYALAGHDALAIVDFLAQARLEDGDVVDQLLRTEVKVASPVLAFFRLVGRFTWEGRRRDTSQAFVTLGGDNGLRGYVSQAFFERGGNLIRGNVELRTVPIELWSIHFGAVLFYDVGTVYGDVGEIDLHHGVGLGFRMLFPQFNRTPFRFDGGVPLEGDHRPVPSIGGLQVVPLTDLDESG